MKHNAATQRERIRQYLYRCQFGATRNEIHRDTGLMVQTLCRRLRELEDLGHIAGIQRVICPETGVLNKNYRLTGNQRAAMTRKAGRAA
ncbi:MAG: hypothetical protein CL539_06180 [Alcanivorax sp.]|uniref:hypothetical protein n=1 Tax=unclassified Alcanivorax TaxID=2638842 RepID=UPI000C8940B2|nr:MULTISPECIES: hypothetical protein [unclassified Alcanivorax]MAC14253.1 hypothetical protein [Alcanivorax sp.]|tara:strand:- start:1396 stop:1662 length:267 start_codon:yes stop_codon:yes gene_type:complete